MLRAWAAWMGQEGFSLSCLEAAAESVVEQNRHRRGDFASPSGSHFQLTFSVHSLFTLIMYIFSFPLFHLFHLFNLIYYVHDVFICYVQFIY